LSPVAFILGTAILLIPNMEADLRGLMEPDPEPPSTIENVLSLDPVYTAEERHSLRFEYVQLVSPQLDSAC